MGGSSPFANYRFQKGVAIIGFAEHFGQRIPGKLYIVLLAIF